MKVPITVEINGIVREAAVEPRTLLANFLRDDLGLTGTHIGCETANCGACAVILDGRAVKSCTVLAVQANEKNVVTIEGIGTAEKLHPIQYAFWKKHGLQCGFCTPGMIISAYALLEKNLNPDEEEIRKGLSGNLCRCTGYSKIIESVKYAAQLRKKNPKAVFSAEPRRTRAEHTTELAGDSW
jgi:aerobic carbon-monoxide dehydrogenase small subunit